MLRFVRPDRPEVGDENSLCLPPSQNGGLKKTLYGGVKKLKIKMRNRPCTRRTVKEIGE